jgi:hypothetical protein
MLHHLLKRSSAAIAVFLLLGYFYISSFSTVVHALPTDWMDTSENPSLQSQWTIDQTTFNESNNLAISHSDGCETKAITTRPKRTGQTEQKTSSNICWQKTPIGLMPTTTDNYLVANGTNVAGPITGRTATMSYQKTLKTNVFLDLRRGSSSNYTKIISGDSVTTTTASTGTVSHAYTPTSTFEVKFSNNNALGSSGAINYSDNGKWLVSSATNTALFRINLETNQILNFGAPVSGSSNPYVSITDDGRYAVVVSGVQTGWTESLAVYDLHNCTGTEQSTIAVSHANCAKRDLSSFLSGNITSYNKYTKAKFLDNDTIVFYHYNSDTPVMYTQYLMSITNASSSINYMALGDSYSSGEGAQNYLYPTNTGEAFNQNNCHLSGWSYPHLIEGELTPNSFKSFACSGAKLVNVSGGNGVRNDENMLFRDNQYYVSDWATTYYEVPGYDAQVNKVALEKPNVITIGISGNDIGFAKKIQRCLNLDTCYPYYEDRLEIANEINDVFYRSVKLFKKIKSNAAPGAKIYVVGYPSIASDADNCELNVNDLLFTNDERALSNLIVSRLNLVLKQAADNAGVRYVDVEDAFYGQRLCEINDNNVAINGLTVGQEAVIIGAETYHPNLRGQRLLRDAVLAETSNFTQSMPAPDSTKTIPDVNSSIPLLDAPEEFRAAKSTILDNMIANDVVVRGTSINASIDGALYGTKSGSTYEVWRYSTPVQIGSYTSDDNGNIDISATMPIDTPPGYHTIHIFGKNMDNVDIDIYTVVYVAASEEDWDGDEIVNEEDPCLIIEESGIDSDLDEIDDACDPLIGEIEEE